MDAKRVAVAGYGLAGRYFHAPLVAATPGLAVTHIITGSAERAAAARAEHPGVSVVASVEDCWGEVDLLVVATPNSAHVPLAEAALDHGVAVVVDKPLALDARSAARLRARAVTAGVALSVFHNRRWDSDLLTLRGLLDRGRLGRVLTFESRFERWRPDAPATLWRAESPAEGGGLLLDLGSHLVDQALLLFGPVTTVSAEVRVVRPGHVGEDDAFLALTHASGTVSHLRMSAICAAPGPRLRVLGSEAAYVIDGLDGQETALREGRRPDDGRVWGVEPESTWGRLLHGESGPGAGEVVPTVPGDWPAYYAAMAACLRGEVPVPVDANAAVDVLLVLEAARASAQGGETIAVAERSTLAFED